MAVTPDQIAVELGRTAPDANAAEYAQWELWIADALFQIAKRPGLVFADLDPDTVDYVVRKAVVRHVRRPDEASTVTTAVDDANVSRTYRSASSGDVEIRDEWWAMLTPAATTTRAFSVRPSGYSAIHAEICTANRYVDGEGNVVFGGAFCSCAADIAGFPLYENDY